MNVLSNDEINHIRGSVNIVDVIGEYLPLTQKGKNFFGVCPFHDDHSPSMSVSSEKQIYTCFSCGATGNVFKFIMDYEHISFPEALKKVADKAGIDIAIGDFKKNTNTRFQSLYDIYEVAVKFYQNNINTKEGKEAKEYLRGRDITDDIIREFGIGLSIKNREMLTKLLLGKEFAHADLLKSGLVVKNEYGYQDIYYNRIMFPLWDPSGKVVGFSGRVYHGEKEFKYINTKETDIFKKGELLYNYHRAKEEARMKQSVIIMEGFMDVIRAYTVGVKNVIATMGTAVTKEQAGMIKKMAKEVILCFDGDRAGAKATLACSNELLEMGVIPKIVRLEKDLDPDEYIKKYGKEKFLAKLENPISVMDFKLNYLKQDKDLSSTVDMANYVNTVIQELAKIDDEVMREISLKKISQESNLDLDFLKARLNNLKEKQEPIKEVPRVLEVNERPSKYQKAEAGLLYYMLRYPEVIKMYQKKITYMPTDRYRYLAREINYFYKNYQSIDMADFITFIGEDQELLKTLGEINRLNLKEEYKIDEINDYINVILEYNIKVETARLKEQMKRTSDPFEKANIAKQIVGLKMRRDESD